MKKIRRFMACFLAFFMIFIPQLALGAELGFYEGTNLSPAQMKGLFSTSDLTPFYPLIRDDLYSNGRLRFEIYDPNDFSNYNLLQYTGETSLSNLPRFPFLNNYGIWYDGQTARYLSYSIKNGYESETIYVYGFSGGVVKKLVELDHPDYLNVLQSNIDLRISKVNPGYQLELDFNNVYPGIPTPARANLFYYDDGNGNLSEITTTSPGQTLSFYQVVTDLGLGKGNEKLEREGQVFKDYETMVGQLKPDLTQGFFTGIEDREVLDFKKSLLGLFLARDFGLEGKVDDRLVAPLLSRLAFTKEYYSTGPISQAPYLLKDSPYLPGGLGAYGTYFKDGEGHSLKIPKQVMEAYFSKRYGIQLEDREYKAGQGTKAMAPLVASLSGDTLSILDKNNYHELGDILTIKEFSPYYNFAFARLNLLSKTFNWDSQDQDLKSQDLYVVLERYREKGKTKLRPVYFSSQPLTLAGVEEALERTLIPNYLKDFSISQALALEEDKLMGKLWEALGQGGFEEGMTLEEPDKDILYRLGQGLRRKPVQVSLKGTSLVLNDKFFQNIIDARPLPKDFEDFLSQHQVDLGRDQAPYRLDLILPKGKSSLEFYIGKSLDPKTLPKVISIQGQGWQAHINGQDLMGLEDQFLFLEGTKAKETGKLKVYGGHRGKRVSDLDLCLHLILPNEEKSIRGGSKASPDMIRGIKDQKGKWITYPILKTGVYETIKSDYKDSFSKVYRAGLDNRFALDSPLTRGLFARAISDILGLSKDGREIKLADMGPRQLFYEDALSALENGYMTSKEGEFSPGDPMTREGVYYILGNILRQANIYEKEGTSAKGLKSYGDYGDISEWALDNIALAKQEGLVLEGDLLLPKATMTLEEVGKLVDILGQKTYFPENKEAYKLVKKEDQLQDSSREETKALRTYRANLGPAEEKSFPWFLVLGLGLCLGLGGLVYYKKRTKPASEEEGSEDRP